LRRSGWSRTHASILMGRLRSIDKAL
jgi:hypothetical protein